MKNEELPIVGLTLPDQNPPSSSTPRPSFNTPGKIPRKRQILLVNIPHIGFFPMNFRGCENLKNHLRFVKKNIYSYVEHGTEIVSLILKY